MKIEITATEPQSKFLMLEHEHRAFVGGYGTGKSQTLVNALLIDALRVGDGPKRLVAAYEPSYDLVKLILVERIMEALETQLKLPYKYHGSDYRFHIQGAADIILRSLSNPERIVGYEAATAHIDELDTLPSDKAADVYGKITARTRFKYNGPNQKSVYTTPEGFKFVYDTWRKGVNVDNIINHDVYKEVVKDESFASIQAHTESNIFLPEGYVGTLEGVYPSHILDAYLKGEYVNMVSGTVYRCYSRKECNTDETIQGDEPLHIGCDFNVEKQCAAIFVKRVSVDGQNDQYHMVDELYNMLDTPDMIQKLKDRYPNNPITIYPDASGTARKSVGATNSDIGLLQKSGFHVPIEIVKGRNPAIKDRVLAVNSGLEKRIIRVNADRCPQTVSCLEQQPYDKNGMPDKTGGFDHMADAVGYFVNYKLPIHKPIAAVPFKFAI